MAKSKKPSSFQLIGQPKDLSSYIDPVEERLRNALKSQPGELVGTPYTPKSKFDQLIERLEPSMKMSSETPDISAKLSALETPETGFQLGESKDLSTRINPTEERLRNALKSQSGEMVGTPYTPKSKFDQLIERLEPSMKMSSETPDISAKLMATEKSTPVVEKLAEQEIQKLASSSIPEVPTTTKTVGNIGKLDEAMEKLSSLSDDVLAKLGPLGQKIMASKIVTKGLPAYGAYQEARDLQKSLKKDQYLDAMGNALGIASSGAALLGSAVPSAGLAAASIGVGGGAKLGREEAEFGVGEGGMMAPSKEELLADKQNASLNNKASFVSPLTEKELSNLQAPTSSSLPPKNAGPQIPYPTLVPQSKTIEEPGSSTEELQAAPPTEDQPQEQLEDQQSTRLQPYQDMLNLQQQMSESSVDALRKAQEEAKQERGLAALHQAANQILGGTLGLTYKTASPDVTGANQFWKERAKNAGQVVEDLKQRSEQEKEDPTSEASVAMRRLAAPMLKGLGIALPENMSFNSIQKNFPMFTKMFDVQEMSKQREERAAEKKAEKLTETDVKRFDKLSKDIDPSRASGRSQLGIDAKNVAVIENAKALLSGEKDLNSIDSRQIYETVRLLDRVVSGGNPTISASQHLQPETYKQQLTTFMEKLTNKRQGAGAASFLKSNLDTFDRELKQATERLEKSAMAGSSSYKDLMEKYPEKWDELMVDHGYSHILSSDKIQEMRQKRKNVKGDKSEQIKETQKSTKEDAINWAKQNINSKDKENANYAKQILQLHGVK